jgi:secreted trypsin-like serine protease
VIAACCAVAAAAPASGQARPAIRPVRAPTANILGGSTAVGTSLGMVARITYNDGSQAFVCSGTVVASNVILTAGHCAENETTGVVDIPADYQVLTGSQSLSSPGQVSDVIHVIPYPAFDPSTLSGDASLLVLATPTSVSPVMLASDPADLSLYNGGTETAITGWGIADSFGDLPSTLQYGFSVVQNAGYCAQHAGQFGFDSLRQLCAVDAPTDENGTCNGDSGGPILTVVDQTWVEIGLTSFGADDCNTAQPGFFTRTDTIDAWIQGELQQNALAPPSPSPPTTVTSTPTAPIAPTTPSQPPTALPAPKAGLYRGRTTQNQPISVQVNPSRTTISNIRLEFNLRCTRHPALRYTETPGLTVKLSLRSGMGFRARFHDSTGTKYRLTGTFGTSGNAVGTLTITWQTARYGRCASGPLSWYAST